MLDQSSRSGVGDEVWGELRDWASPIGAGSSAAVGGDVVVRGDSIPKRPE
jgi:hypothetical protein